jgi:hypothetical protein
VSQVRLTFRRRGSAMEFVNPFLFSPISHRLQFAFGILKLLEVALIHWVRAILNWTSNETVRSVEIATSTTRYDYLRVRRRATVLLIVGGRDGVSGVGHVTSEEVEVL